jgi:hypothetical protein
VGTREPGRTGPAGPKKGRGRAFDSSNKARQNEGAAVHAGKTTGREEEECGGGPKCHSDAVTDTA